MPKQDSANATMVRIRPTLGACLIKGSSGRWRRQGAVDSLNGVLGQSVTSFGKFARRVSIASCGFAWTRFARVLKLSQVASTVPRSIGP